MRWCGGTLATPMPTTTGAQCVCPALRDGERLAPAQEAHTAPCLLSTVLLPPHHRGVSYDKLGKHEEAAADFTAVIERDPGNTNAYYARAAAWDSLGQFERAVADYRKALDFA